MDWNVKNAVNRDVERQHLNKILKEIKTGQDDVSTRLAAATGAIGNVQNSLNSTVINIINQTLPPGALATSVTLNGDVAGTSVPVPGQNAVTIQTTLTKTYLEDAPSNQFAYWRRAGNWEQVSIIIDGLNLMFDQGLMVWSADDLTWYARTIETADADRITVTDGDGLLANPTLDLALVPDDGTGVLQRTSFDAWGRKTGTAAATTDHLPEGVVNLYFTDERAQDATGAMVDDSSNITLTYNDATPSLVADLIDTAVTPGSYGDSGNVPTIVVDAKGRITSASESPLALPKGQIVGLNMTWDSTTGITVSSGAAYVEGEGRVVEVPSVLVASGLSLSASSWYHAYLYLNAGTPAIEVSGTTPDTPYDGTARSKTGDTSRRYVGSIRTDSSGNIYNFLQTGNLVLYREQLDAAPFRLIANGTATTTTAVSAAAVAPVTSRAAQLRVFNLSSGAGLNTGTSDGVTNMFTFNPGDQVFLTHPLNGSREMTYAFLAAPAPLGTYIDATGYLFER